MSEQRYFVLKELEVELSDIEEGDIFRTSGDQRLWKALKDGMAEPVALMKIETTEDLNLKKAPKSYQKLGERNGQQRQN